MDPKLQETVNRLRENRKRNLCDFKRQSEENRDRIRLIYEAQAAQTAALRAKKVK